MAQWLRVRLLMQGHRFDPRAASERSPGATTTEPALTTVSAPHSLQLENLYLQVKYKEVIGQGTPIPNLPEVKRVKQTQKHISSVMAPPRAGPFLHHPFLLLPAWTTLPAL